MGIQSKISGLLRTRDVNVTGQAIVWLSLSCGSSRLLLRSFLMLQLLQTPLVKNENDLLRDRLSHASLAVDIKFVSVIITQEQMHAGLMSARYKYTVTDF